MRSLILILALLCSNFAFGQTKLDVEIEVINVIEAGGEILQTNGKNYLITEGEVKPIPSAIIDTGNSELKWIIVRKLSAGGRSTVLRNPFDGDRFLFLGITQGEYEVQTSDAEGFPVFDYFTVGDVPPPTEPPPTDPPPTDPPADKFDADVQAAISSLPDSAKTVRQTLAYNVSHVRVNWVAGNYKRANLSDSIVAMSIALTTANQNSCTPEQYKAWQPVWIIIQQRLLEDFEEKGEAMDIVGWLTRIEKLIKG